MKSFEPIVGRARGYLSIIRPPNCLMIGLAVIVGEAISLGGLPQFIPAVLGFGTAALMMAGTMVLNDIYDVDADRLNSPGRPIPSGKVPVKTAYYLAVGLSLASLVFSFSLGLLSL